MTPDRFAITTTGLTKSFACQPVLNGVNLNVRQGSIVALLGGNGAGKTTTINILTTLLRPDSGTAVVNGFDVMKDPDRVRASIGVTGQFAAIDMLLTGLENLRIMAKLAHLAAPEAKARISHLLTQFDLEDAATKPVATYSGGMRRRLDLAMSLILDPSIVFLDEPTTGIDPRGRAVMWEIVKGLARDGKTIFLTTQYLEEADQLADEIAVLNEGRIIAHGDPMTLKGQIGTGHLQLQFGSLADLTHAAHLFAGSNADEAALALRIPDMTAPDRIHDTLWRCQSAGVEIRNLSIVKPDLDDVFFALTGSAPAKGTESP